MEYQKLYHSLFNAITDALEDMEQANYGLAAERLRRAQIEAEEAYLEDGDEGVAGRCSSVDAHPPCLLPY